MNYKTDIPVYEPSGYLDQQLTVLFDEELYEDIERISIDLDLSMNAVIRSLLAHGVKHCKIDTVEGDTCRNCVCYLADDKENYVCCNERSPYCASFRPKDSWCVFHKRR